MPTDELKSHIEGLVRAEARERLADHHRTLADDELERLLVDVRSVLGQPAGTSPPPSVDHDDGPADPSVRQRWASALGMLETAGEHPDVLLNVIQEELRRRRGWTDPRPPARHRWWTYLGLDHGPRAEGVRRLAPRSIPELRSMLEALPVDGRIRVSGGRHSSSEIAVPDDGQAWLDTDLLLDISPLGDAATPEDSWSVHGRLVRVPAGLRIHALNRWLLEEHHLAMPNLGSYDAQSICGAVATATHGSGAHLGPLSDFVEAFDTVVVDEEDGRRVTRLVRITGSASVVPQGDVDEVIADDRALAAARVGLGSLGFVVAVVLRVRDEFWIDETRTRVPFGKTLDALVGDVQQAAADGVHVEFLFHPYGPYPARMMRLERRILHRRPPMLGSRPSPGCGASFRRDGPTSITATSTLGTPDFVLDIALSTAASLEPPKPMRADEGFLLRIERFTAASSIEVAVPLERAADAASKIREIALDAWRREHPPRRLWSPIGLRFVASTDAYLAPQYRHHPLHGEVDVWAMFELPLPLIAHQKRWKGARRLLHDIARELGKAPFGARLHWGQEQRSTVNDIRRLWGDAPLQAWVEARRRLDPLGVLRNRFTEQSGLDAVTWPARHPSNVPST